MTRPTKERSGRSWGPVMASMLVAAAGFALTLGCAKRQIVQEEKNPAAEKQQAAATDGRGETPEQKLEEDLKLTPIHFDYDRADIRPDDGRELRQYALELKEGKFRGVRLTIEGNCDERGSAEYNMALGERRARATSDYLRRLGIRKDRMKTVSYGKERPVDPGHNEEAWYKNRRSDFVPGS